MRAASLFRTALSVLPLTRISRSRAEKNNMMRPFSHPKSYKQVDAPGHARASGPEINVGATHHPDLDANVVLEALRSDAPPSAAFPSLVQMGSLPFFDMPTTTRQVAVTLFGALVYVPVQIVTALMPALPAEALNGIAAPNGFEASLLLDVGEQYGRFQEECGGHMLTDTLFMTVAVPTALTVTGMLPEEYDEHGHYLSSQAALNTMFICAAWLWAGMSCNAVFMWTCLTSSATLVPSGRWVDWYCERGHKMRCVAYASHARAMAGLMLVVATYPIVLYAAVHPLRAALPPIIFLWTLSEFWVRIFDKDWVAPAFVLAAMRPEDPVATARHHADAAYHAQMQGGGPDAERELTSARGAGVV